VFRGRDRGSVELSKDKGLESKPRQRSMVTRTEDTVDYVSLFNKGKSEFK